MANPNILPSTMLLYSTFAPEGRLFQQGEDWPGDAWSQRPGGEPIGGDAVAQAMKDLIEAQDQIDRLSQAVSSKDHDMAQMAKQRDDAVAELNGLKQSLLDAEKAQKDAEKIATGLTKERDRARADLQALQNAQASASAPVEAAA